MNKSTNNNKRRNCKNVISKEKDHQSIPDQEAQKDKKEETTTMMTKIVKEDHPKIERIRKKVEKKEEGTGENVHRICIILLTQIDF